MNWSQLEANYIIKSIIISLKWILRVMCIFSIVCNFPYLLPKCKLNGRFVRDFQTLKGVSAVCVTKRLDYNYNKITTTRPNYRRSGQDISVTSITARHYKLTKTCSLILSDAINILIAELIKNVSLMDENDRPSAWAKPGIRINHWMKNFTDQEPDKRFWSIITRLRNTDARFDQI